MAADLTTIMKKHRSIGPVPIDIYVLKNAQSDWIVIDGVKGVTPLRGFTQTAAANVAETFTHGAMTIDNSGTAYTATSTSITVASAAVTRKPPYYVATNGGEIMEVTSETLPAAAGSVLTVRRGVLGTTASLTGLAHTNVVSILNMLILGSSSTGPTWIKATPMTGDPTPTDTFA
jgi:hypothetical protein